MQRMAFCFSDTINFHHCLYVVTQVESLPLSSTITKTLMLFPYIINLIRWRMKQHNQEGARGYSHEYKYSISI